jgi:hypothetical protein
VLPVEVDEGFPDGLPPRLQGFGQLSPALTMVAMVVAPLFIRCQ